MKKLIAVLLIIVSTNQTFADYSCDNQPYDYKAKVPRVAPKKARTFIKDSSELVHAGIAELDATESEIKNALLHGIDFQRFGNTSLVWNLDALISMQRDSELFWKAVILIRDPSNRDDYYYSLNQSLAGLRVVEVLKFLKRDKEAHLLEAYIEKTLVAIEKGDDGTELA